MGFNINEASATVFLMLKIALAAGAEYYFRKVYTYGTIQNPENKIAS